MQLSLPSCLVARARALQNWLSRRGERSKQIMLGSGMVMVSTMLTTLARVGMIALLARIYAREEFGVWVAITSATAILATSDFGMGNALRNKLAALAVRGKTGHDEAREYFLSVFYFFLIAALVLSVGLLIISRFIPLQMLFKTSDVALQRAGADILIAVQVIFLVGIPLGMGPVMFFAYQESAWSAGFSLAYGLIGAIVVCGLALLGQSIVTTAIWYFLSGLIVTTAGTAIFLYRRRWNPWRVTPRLILPRVWSLLSLSLRFAAVQISGAFIYNAATLVTCAAISVADAAEYNLVQKLYAFALGLYLSVYNPLWAGYADAAHRGDWGWCRRTLMRTMALSAAAFVGLAVVFTIFGNFFLQVLAGKGYVSQPALFALLGLWALFHILWGCVMTFLTAVERINIMMVMTIIGAVLFTPLSGMLGQRFGISGIAVSSVLVLAPLAILGHVQAFWIVRQSRSVKPLV